MVEDLKPPRPCYGTHCFALSWWQSGERCLYGGAACGTGEGQGNAAGLACATGKTLRVNIVQTWKITPSASSSLPPLSDTQLHKIFCGCVTQKSVFFPKKLFYSVPESLPRFFCRKEFMNNVYESPPCRKGWYFVAFKRIQSPRETAWMEIALLQLVVFCLWTLSDCI